MEYLAELVEQSRNLIFDTSIKDSDVDSWFFMDSHWPLVTVTSFYLYFVLKIGPQYMENRKPYNLKYVLLVYNAALSIFNGFILVMALVVARGQLFIAHSSQEEAHPLLKSLNEVYWYFEMSKLVELLDTIFFVLRKKQSQISVLHVYHHSVMVMGTWMYLKYAKSPHGNFICIINSFIHVVMYFYYFLAAFGPRIQKYLWWKKYLTMMQLTQFSFVLLYLVLTVLLDPKENRRVILYLGLNTTFFACLFLNFYNKEYKNKSSSTKKIDVTEQLKINHVD